MYNRIFVDVNVWVDLFDVRRPLIVIDCINGKLEI